MKDSKRTIIEDPNIKNKEKYNVLAIIGFILAFVVPLIGLILSIIAVVYISPNEKGKELAVAGIVVSALIIILIVIIIVGSFYLVAGSLDMTEINSIYENKSMDCQDGYCENSYDGRENIDILKRDNNLKTNYNVS